ncbi:hypothetical protein JMJ35_001389 [Cladonia borealis]|uniref:Protein BIG1 n=1 Tax=Cladonia borealis TaxID=184061 RepID=A0AA39RAQ1_9LECA|nr:hypothetical protein JMJ35_001389 [Cladonia borealis]
MLFTNLGALALSAAIVEAFKDTSPFFLFSTSELLTSSPDLISASRLSEIVIPELTKCTSETYIIVSQPGVGAADYENKRSAPHLRKRLLGDDKSIRSSLVVKDVLGWLDVDDLSGAVQNGCGAAHLRVDASTGQFTILDDSRPQVITVDFPAPPAGVGRSQKLVENDAFLSSMLDLLSPKTRYTVIYTTSPPTTSHPSEQAEPEEYEMDSLFQAPVHLELKRDMSHQKRASDANITLPNGPLFERYQYLTPGLFMGLLVSFILVSILYVGISGVASLQVSYAAFDKEMGPAAQKKQSQ